MKIEFTHDLGNMSRGGHGQNKIGGAHLRHVPIGIAIHT